MLIRMDQNGATCGSFCMYRYILVIFEDTHRERRQRELHWECKDNEAVYKYHIKNDDCVINVIIYRKTSESERIYPEPKSLSQLLYLYLYLYFLKVPNVLSLRPTAVDYCNLKIYME